EDDVIESFKNNEDGIEMIIVVSKLLTGFDAPCDTVLYLTKDLKDHGLLQAIARVNRLYENETLPKTSGFIIDYSENAKNLDRAMKLFGNFATEDVGGTLVDVTDKIKELEQKHDELNDIFTGVPADDEAFIQHLAAEDDRRLFHDAYNAFVKTFNECLALKDFGAKFNKLDTYKRELAQFTRLRHDVRMRYAEDINLAEYKKPLTDLIDKYVDTTGSVELLTAPVDITDPERFQEAIDNLGSDKSKAEAIAAFADRTIRERMDQDPEYYKSFSEKIQSVIDKMHEGALAAAEALGQIKLLNDEMVNREDSGAPEAIRDVKGAPIFFRNLKIHFEDTAVTDEQYQKIVLGLIDVMKNETIVDWHRNPEVIRIMSNRLDDYLYDHVRQKLGVGLSGEATARIAQSCIDLAKNNVDLFSI
ncbi:MAG: type I restriction enzyme endonuclease domain-containing protein, partial [bacterium]